MKTIKPFHLYEAKSISIEDEAKSLNDVVEPALLGLIEDYDPTIDSRLQDNRLFIIQIMFVNKTKGETGLSVDSVKEFIEDTEYLLGAYKHIYTAMKKITNAGYECKLNHHNNGNADGSPGPYYISLLIPRMGMKDTSEIDWLIAKGNTVTVDSKKLNDWLGNYSQVLEDTSYDENDGTIEFKMEIAGLGLGGEIMSPRQIFKMEKQLKSCNRILDWNIQDTRIYVDIKIEEGEDFDIS